MYLGISFPVHAIVVLAIFQTFFFFFVIYHQHMMTRSPWIWKD